MGCTTEIVARQAAIGVVLRYADALDRADRDLCESCFTENATIDLRPFSVLEMSYNLIKGRKEITTACMSAVSTTMETTHSLTNFLVKLNAQRNGADLICYSESQHIKKGQAFHSESQDNSLIVKCRYEATLVQQGSEWKFESLKIVSLWSKGRMSVFLPAKKKPLEKKRQEDNCRTVNWSCDTLMDADIGRANVFCTPQEYG